MKKESKVKLIDSFEKWGGILNYWNELLMQSRSDTIFLTWEWLYTWAECFLGSDRKLFILAVYQKEKLIGLAPWCIHRIRGNFFSLRQIEFLGSPKMASDYLDVFAKKGKEKEVALQIYDFLFREVSESWDSMSLRDIPANSLFLLYFIESIRQDGKYVDIYEGAFCPFTVLPRSWENFLTNISSNRREQFRRHYRKLQKHVEVKHSTFIHDKVALARFNSLYSNWWGKNQNHQFYVHLEKFANRCQSQSWIQIDFLSADGEDIAALWHLRYKNKLLMYLMAVDKDFTIKISIGNILIGLCLEKAISDGIDIYDFLKGSEDYKFHWANNGCRSIVLNIYQRHLGVLRYVAVNMLKGMAKFLIR
jgi:hypothetical protein